MRRGDHLSELEVRITEALTSMPELPINDWEVNVVPELRPDASTAR